MSFAEDLEALGPCPESIVWVGDKTLRESWDACKDVAWMLWLLAKTAGWVDWPSHETLCELVCRYVEEAPGFEDAYDVIELARLWQADTEPYWKAYQAAEKAAVAPYPENVAMWAGYACKNYWTTPSWAYKAIEDAQLEIPGAIDILRTLIPSGDLPETLSGE